jgi:hypothetical protein
MHRVMILERGTRFVHKSNLSNVTSKLFIAKNKRIMGRQVFDKCFVTLGLEPTRNRFIFIITVTVGDYKFNILYLHTIVRKE